MSRRRRMLAAAGGKVWLYREGDQRTAKTGGWAATLAPNANQGTFTARSTDFLLQNGSTSSYSNPMRAHAVTQHQINTTGKSTLYVEFAANTVAGSSVFYLALYASSTASDINGMVASTVTRAVAVDTPQTVSLDLTSRQGLYNVGVLWHKNAGVSGYFNAYITRVWME